VAANLIDSADRVCISIMSVLELGELLERQRIRVRSSTRTWIRDALAWVEPLPLTAEIALDAAQLRFSGDPFDRVIYATARAEGAPLVTRDRLLREFDPQLTVW
jgi:PIN domain nuclease of toxin-antitoxin system